MAHYYQFVDAISASPGVILDLDDGNPLEVSDGTNLDPPGISIARVMSMLADGEQHVDSVFGDREIRLELNLAEVGPETQATAIQKLVRLLARKDGALLKWQDEDMSQPRFYRTKRASARVLDDIVDATPRRQLSVTIPAHPFSYGLPESPAAVAIGNNPATGGTFYTFPTIKGDVPAPLHLSFTTPEADHDILVASTALLDTTTMSGPLWRSLSADAISAPGGNWTVADQDPDATMVSGKGRRMTLSAGAGSARPSSALMMQWAGLPAGEYRVMVRVFGGDTNTTLHLFNRPPDNPSPTATLVAADAVRSVKLNGSVNSPVRDWVDMGVVALPYGAPPKDLAFGLNPSLGTALYGLLVSATGPMSIDLDGILLIPVRRSGMIARVGRVGFSPFYSAKAVTIDGVNDQRFATGQHVLTGVTSPVPIATIDGDTPIVVPGANNYLHFLATASTMVASPRNYTGPPGPAVPYDRISDDKTLSTNVTWKYYPAYLYNRPAAT